MKHYSDGSKLRNFGHFFCPLMGWLILLSHESPPLHPSFLACSMLLFSSSAGLLFPSNIPSPLTSSCIFLPSPYPSFLLSLTKKTHEKPHVPTLLFISGINIFVNNLFNHRRLITVGANSTARVVHPLCKQKWKSLEGWPSKKQKKTPHG